MHTIKIMKENWKIVWEVDGFVAFYDYGNRLSLDKHYTNFDDAYRALYKHSATKLLNNLVEKEYCLKRKVKSLFLCGIAILNIII